MHLTSKAGRALAVASGTAALVALGSAPASAHLQVTPAQIEAGHPAELKFAIKSEFEQPTTRFELLLPVEEAPDLQATAGKVPGWKVTTKKIAMPISPARKEAGHLKTSGVGSIVWTAEPGKGVKPKETQEFPVTLRNVPGADRLAFRGVQTYKDGQTVRWFDVPGAEGDNVFQPAALVAVGGNGPAPAPGGGHAGHGAPAAASASAAPATQTDDAQVATGENAAESRDLDLTSAPVIGGLSAVGGLLLGLLVGMLLGRRGRTSH